MAKIVFFDVEPHEEEYINNNLKGHNLVFLKAPLTEENVSQANDADAIGVFIYSKVSAEMIDKMPNLKFIATLSTGFDHIDLEKCKQRSIVVSNVPSYGENTVAEHAFALMLALSRKIVESVDHVKTGNFSLEGLMGFDLKGKTLGVVGTGKIGRHAIRMALGFEMNVIAFDPLPDNEYAKQTGFSYADFDTLLKQSDIITLHAPLNDHTKHMINKNNINKIKKGAYLINTARGGLVETEALLMALDQGILSGAGLDVLEEECMILEEKQLLSHIFNKECNLEIVAEEHMIISNPKVIVTPHNAFNSIEGVNRILSTTVSNINGFFSDSPANIVKK